MRSQRMLRLVRWLPLFALLAILGIGAVVVRLRGPFKEHLRRAVVWELSRSLGRPVGVKESRLSLVRPQGQNLLLRLSVSGLSVAQPAGFAKPGAADFLRIPELRLDFQPRGLFSSKGALSALRRAELRRPEIYLVRDRQGRWNFSELLARRPAKPSRFTGRVEVAGGRLRVQDFSPPSGLNIPQVNNLENLRFLTSSPQPGRFYFRLWGENPQRHLERIFAAGQWGAGALSSLRGSAFSAAGPAQQAAMAAAEGGLATHNSQARLSASVALTQVDLGYLWRYWSPVRGLKIATGRADVTGYFSSRQSEPGVDYAVAATASRAEVGLPWLRGQVKEARGLVRGGNGLLQFSRLEGRLEAAAITGDGYLLTFPRGTAGKPGASYAFQLHARNTGRREIASALPLSIAPTLAQWQGRAEGGINIAGKAKNSAVFGALSGPQWQVDTAAVRGPLPTVAEIQRPQVSFIYARDALAATAEGGVLGGSAKGAIFFPPKAGNGEFAASLAGVELPAAGLPFMVSGVKPGGKATITGKTYANLRGEVPLLDRKTAPALAGDIALVNGEARFPLAGGKIANFALPRATADFSYDPGGLSLTGSSGPTAYGSFDFSGRLSPTGAVQAYLQGRNIALANIGEKVGVQAGGAGFVSAYLSGTTENPHLEVRGDVFFGTVGGYEYDWLGAEALLQGREIPRFSLVFQRGSGEGRFAGKARLPTATDPGTLWAEGKIEKAQIADWLPEAALKQQVRGVLDGQVSVRGSPRAPQVEASFQIGRPLLGGMQFDTAEGALRYQEGRFSLSNFAARVNGAQLTASGEMNPRGELDFGFTAERLALASLLQSVRASAPVEGQLSLRGRLEGTARAPRASLWMRAADLVFAQRRAGDVEGRLTWDGSSLAIQNLDFAAQGGHLRVSGNLTRPHLKSEISNATLRSSEVATSLRSTSLKSTPAWQSHLSASLEGMQVGLLLDLLEGGLQAYQPRPTAQTDRLRTVQAALARIPRPARGFLTATASIEGPVTSPIGEVEFALSEGSVAGQQLPSLEGKAGFRAGRLDLHSLLAKEGEAYAAASGQVEFAGQTDLNIDVHNLRAEVLQPWIKQFTGLGGSADIYLRVSGPTHDPEVRGDLEVADPAFGEIHLERMKIDRFTFAANRLEIEDLRLVKGPHHLRVSASLPYSLTRARLEEEGPLRAEVSLENQDLAFLSALWPRWGEFAGPVQMNLLVGGTAAQPRMESGFIRAQGKWQKGPRQALISLEGQVEDHTLRLKSAGGDPGLVVSLQRVVSGKVSPEGTVRAGGDYDPFAGPPSRWGLGAYDIAVAVDSLQGEIGKLLTGRLQGDLRLQGNAQGDKITGLAEIPAGAVLTIPARGPGGPLTWRPRFSPELKVKVVVKEARVSTAAARIYLSGEGEFTGRLGYEPLGLQMRLTSTRGALEFPAAVAKINKMSVDLSKKPEEALQVIAHVEAEARVGRYLLTLNGGGPLFPTSDLRINAASSPPLPEAQATAMLLGVPPGLLGTTGLASEQVVGQQVAQNLSTNITALAAAGISAPLLRAIGLSELSFGVSSVASRLEVGKRVADKIYIYYLSSTTGAVHSTLLRLIYDFTRRLSVGFSINEQEQWRYEIQTNRVF